MEFYNLFSRKKNYDIHKLQNFKKITIVRNILNIRRLCFMARQSTFDTKFKNHNKLNKKNTNLRK